jgi:hypothetical protein
MEKDAYANALRKYDWRVHAASISGCASEHYPVESEASMDRIRRRVDREMIARYGTAGREA